VADALSRQPEVCSTQTVPQCNWHRRILTGLRERPAEFLDYQERASQLYRYVLHAVDFQETDNQWKRCVPREERPEVLQRHHAHPTARVAKIIARMARLYYWPGMFQDITRYVRRCPICLAHKAGREPAYEPGLCSSNK